MKLFAALWTAAAAAPRCNPESYAAEQALQNNVGVTPAPIQFLPQDKGDESPACLDGSRYGFYFRPSATNSTKWTISINGGGWCYDEIDCACRANSSLGSSKALTPTDNCACMNPREDGSIDPHCNCLHLPYSDGASFSGYRAEPWAVPGMAQQLTFRGIKNLDGVLDFAMAHGMDRASQLVVTGASAGGLSTFLHTDRAAARVPKAKVRGAPVVGYFLDHDNFKHTTGGQPNTPEWSKPGVGANYTAWMKYVHQMQNMSFGADGGLAAACQAKHPDEPWLCFMSPHMQDVIRTPFFMFNSKYDAWQLQNILQSRWSSKAEQQAVLQYGKDFLDQLAPVFTSNTGGDGEEAETKNGGMITSCICHGCPWSSLVLENKTSFQHYADWFYGKTTGVASMHIDARLPNGDGALSGPTFKQCAHFPKQAAALETRD